MKCRYVNTICEMFTVFFKELSYLLLCRLHADKAAPFKLIHYWQSASKRESEWNCVSSESLCPPNPHPPLCILLLLKYTPFWIMNCFGMWIFLNGIISNLPSNSFQFHASQQFLCLLLLLLLHSSAASPRLSHSLMRIHLISVYPRLRTEYIQR